MFKSNSYIYFFTFSGYPEHMTFGEFQHRFSILAPTENRQVQPVLDEKKVRNHTPFCFGVNELFYAPVHTCLGSTNFTKCPGFK